MIFHLILKYLQNNECVEQLHKLMLDLSKEHGEDKTYNFIKDLLQNNTKSVALLINERYVNIPPPISVPLLQSIRYNNINYK